MHQLTTVERVREDGPYLFTAEGPYGDPEEIMVVPCEEGVEAWINRCTHEEQRFDTGRGVPTRDGEAAGTTLPGVAIAERHGTVFLIDDSYEFAHEGGIDDDDGPSSTSHLQL